MPASLRFVLALLGLALIAAPISVSVLLGEEARAARVNAEAMTGGRVARGEAAVRRFGCTGCHAMSVLRGPSGLVGPPLSGIASRAEIAGSLANTPEHMVAWLRFPQQLRPGCGMPQQPMTEAEARDLAAYLYTLRSG
ncbi:MAG: cytochrome c [Sphingomonadales bacterium]|nr:cytochrome c [Sphingomonadales bacterium]